MIYLPWIRVQPEGISLNLPGLLETGIEALDRVLPKGIPRNTMMILAGELGTGKSVLMGELFYNILKKRKEPCIYVNFEGPPIAVEQDMEAFGWNLTPFLESGQLKFLDCFSFRMEPTQVPPYVHHVSGIWDCGQSPARADELVQGMEAAK